MDCINNVAPSVDGSQAFPDDIRIEAAHVIASLSYGMYNLQYQSLTSLLYVSYLGSLDALRTLLQFNAPQAFLFAISLFQPSDSPKLKSAFARALRALAVAIAEVVGPPQWGLHDNSPDIRTEAKAALDYLFQVTAFVTYKSRVKLTCIFVPLQLEVLDIYLPLLVDPSPQTGSSIAQLLASTVRTQAHRTAVSEWLPPTERIKEVKGKRGWEKPDAANSPSRQGGWVARSLTALLQRRDSKVSECMQGSRRLHLSSHCVQFQEAALSAIACLAHDNPTVAAKLAKAPPDQEGVTEIFVPYASLSFVLATLTPVLSFCKSRTTDLRLAACLWCVTSIRTCQ